MQQIGDGIDKIGADRAGGLCVQDGGDRQILFGMHQELGLDEPVTFCIKNGTGMVRGGSDADDKVVRAAMGRAFEPAQNNANLAAFDDRDIIAIARQTLTRQAGGAKSKVELFDDVFETMGHKRLQLENGNSTMKLLGHFLLMRFYVSPQGKHAKSDMFMAVVRNLWRVLRFGYGYVRG